MQRETKKYLQSSTSAVIVVILALSKSFHLCASKYVYLVPRDHLPRSFLLAFQRRVDTRLCMLL